jgi:hypothetical protein
MKIRVKTTIKVMHAPKKKELREENFIVALWYHGLYGFSV